MSTAQAAAWRGHVSPVRAGAYHPWLTAKGSLTARLVAHSKQFRVRRLHQSPRPCLRDEAALLALRPGQMAWEREVLLVCDDRPAVFAHTVVPLSATNTDWPLFGGLGERSLGTTLFGDPLVERGALQFARLPASHPLLLRAAQALDIPATGPLFARRCLYKRRRGLLLVTEVFLPAVVTLSTPATPIK